MFYMFISFRLSFCKRIMLEGSNLGFECVIVVVKLTSTREAVLRIEIRFNFQMLLNDMFK